MTWTLQRLKGMKSKAKHTNPHQFQTALVKKSAALRMAICIRMHSRQVVVVLRAGAGGIVPILRKFARVLEKETMCEVTAQQEGGI